MTARGPVELITTGSVMIAESGSTKFAESGSAIIAEPVVMSSTGPLAVAVQLLYYSPTQLSFPNIRALEH